MENMSQLDDLDKNLQEAHSLINKLRGTVSALGISRDLANVMEMVRRQEQTLQEQREEIQRERDRCRQLEKERIEFRWEFGEEAEPEDIRDFLIDIGLEPGALPTSLGDRMALRDAIAQTIEARFATD